MTSSRRRWLSLSSIAVLMFLSLSSVFAAEPAQITLAPTWRPGTTLDTIDGGFVGKKDLGSDDYRYVDVDIYVTTTVQFWSVQLTCTASPIALTSYDTAIDNPAVFDPKSDNDPGNSTLPVIWGPMWGSAGEFAPVVEPYDPVKGSRVITATALGNRPMLGSAGVSTVLRIATLRYRAKDVALNTTATFTCLSTFLNRNGQPVMTATYAPPAPLNVLTGYVINGTAQYQGRTNHAGIEVTCTGPGAIPVLKTTATGAWTATARAQGLYSCEFDGNITNPAAGYQPDLYLAASTSFMLSGLSYNLLPVTLGAGNLEITNANITIPDELINSNDVTLITQPSNWNKTAGGDVNGDGKTNQADLAILGTNYGLSELIDARHAIYSLPRNIDAWQNSRIWMGRMDVGAVTQLVPNTTPDSRDLWPTISPDGTKIAFVRDVNLGSGTSTALYVAPLTNGVVGAPVRLTPTTAWYQAFAPSWSPDSTRIAFVCSEYQDGSGNGGVASGYLANIGSLCVIDATGRNWREFASTGAKAKIYPPAWLTNTQVVYGGSSAQSGTGSTGLNVTCPDTLCYFDLLSNTVSLFDANVTGGASNGSAVTQQDMPVIRGDYLFYRYYDNNNTPAIPGDDTRVLRWVLLQRTLWITSGILGDLVTPFGTTGTGAHLRVNTSGAAAISTNVDYYNVNASRYDIALYTSASPDFYKSIASAGPAYTWSTPVINKVDEIQASPNNPDHTPYDVTDPDTGDFVYGYRNTVDWAP